MAKPQPRHRRKSDSRQQSKHATLRAARWQRRDLAWNKLRSEPWLCAKPGSPRERRSTVVSTWPPCFGASNHKSVLWSAARGNANCCVATNCSEPLRAAANGIAPRSICLRGFAGIHHDATGPREHRARRFARDLARGMCEWVLTVPRANAPMGSTSSGEEPTMPALTGNAFAASTIVAAVALAVSPQPAAAETTLTMSSWVSPQHHLTATCCRSGPARSRRPPTAASSSQMLPKHPSAAPGTFDAVRDGLVDVSFVTASYTPARHILPLMAELPGAGATARDQLGRLLAHPLEVLPEGRRVQGREAARRVHPRAGPDVHQEAGHPVADLAGLKIRTGGGIAEAVAQGARRLGVRQAGARVVRAAQLRRRRRRVLPVRVDRLVQARQGDRAGDPVSRAACTARRSASS